jgi:iron complex transport system ATP-binding protein
MSALAQPAPPLAHRMACAHLDVQVAGRLLVRDLNLSIRSGSTTCILGCNGAGKTLTIHTLAGLRAPAAGAVVLDGSAIGDWPRRALARSVGLLTQTTEDPFPSTVLETVLIGRHPHIGFWQWESEADRELAHAALARVGMQDFAQREVATLSGGERRRVALAAILAQDPGVFLLDEPLNHLDPHHQLDVLRLMRERCAVGCSIVMSLHDAGLAARFADDVLLLFGNGEWLSGSAREVLSEATISRLYGVPVREIAWDDGRTFVAV